MLFLCIYLLHLASVIIIKIKTVLITFSSSKIVNWPGISLSRITILYMFSSLQLQTYIAFCCDITLICVDHFFDKFTTLTIKWIIRIINNSKNPTKWYYSLQNIQNLVINDVINLIMVFLLFLLTIFGTSCASFQE